MIKADKGNTTVLIKKLNILNQKIIQIKGFQKTVHKIY